MARRLCHALADLASGGTDGEAVVCEPELGFRPDGRITLQDEFEQARYAVRHARDAIDRMNAALFAVARARWPEQWTQLACKTYRSMLRLNADGSLKVSGCIAFFCQSQRWTRAR
jgi:phosphoenolpyruvate carboxylase